MIEKKETKDEAGRELLLEVCADLKKELIASTRRMQDESFQKHCEKIIMNSRQLLQQKTTAV